jgi:hypothetical protein
MPSTAGSAETANGPMLIVSQLVTARRFSPADSSSDSACSSQKFS